MELFEFGKYGISKKICAAEKQLELSEMVSQKKNLPYRKTYKYHIEKHINILENNSWENVYGNLRSKRDIE